MIGLNLFLGYVESMEVCKQKDGLRHVLNISRLGNQYMQSQQPWVLLKGTDDQKYVLDLFLVNNYVYSIYLFYRTRAGSIISLSCNISCLLALLLSPFMPQTSHTIFNQLNTKLENIGYLDSK